LISWPSFRRLSEYCDNHHHRFPDKYPGDTPELIGDDDDGDGGDERITNPTKTRHKTRTNTLPQTIVISISLVLGRMHLHLIPLHTVVKLDTIPAKAVQRAANSQVDLSRAESLHQVEVLEVAATASIRHRDTTPLGQLLHQFFIDPPLQSFVIRGMDEKLGAIRLEQLDGFYAPMTAVSAF
jgi:hypothetical protein